MSFTFGFYWDSSATQPINPLDFSQDLATPVAEVKMIWLASPQGAAVKLQTETSPGVNNIVLSIFDGTPASGPSASDVKLLPGSRDFVEPSAADWSAATAGAPLSLGATVIGNIPIYVRMANTSSVAGVFTDLQLTTNSVVESAA